MTVVIAAAVKPIIGKSQLAEERVRKVAEIYDHHGGKVRVARVIMGMYAGNMLLQTATPDFTTATSVMSGAMNDDAYQQVMQEREENPGAEMMGPFMFRTIYGDIAWDTHPVSQMRIYQISRKNIPAAVSILGEVDALTEAIKVVGVAPVVSDDMTIIHATYQFKSIPHWGEQIDKIGMSEEFQQLVSKANDLGTLVSSGVYMTI